MKTYIRILSLFLILFLYSCATIPENNQITKITGDLPWELTPFEASYSDISEGAVILEMEDDQEI
jgi:hypothetical protein